MATSLTAAWAASLPFLSGMASAIGSALPYVGTVFLAVLPFACEFLYKEYLRYITALGEEISYLDMALVTMRCNDNLASLYKEDKGYAGYIADTLEMLKPFPVGSLYVSGAQLLPALGVYNKCLSLLRWEILHPHPEAMVIEKYEDNRRRVEEDVSGELVFVLSLAKSPRKNFWVFLKDAAKGKLHSEAMLSKVEGAYREYKEYPGPHSKCRKP